MLLYLGNLSNPRPQNLCTQSNNCFPSPSFRLIHRAAILIGTLVSPSTHPHLLNEDLLPSIGIPIKHSTVPALKKKTLTRKVGASMSRTQHAVSVVGEEGAEGLPKGAENSLECRGSSREKCKVRAGDEWGGLGQGLTCWVLELRIYPVGHRLANYSRGPNLACRLFG